MTHQPSILTTSLTQFIEQFDNSVRKFVATSAAGQDFADYFKNNFFMNLTIPSNSSVGDFISNEAQNIISGNQEKSTPAKLLELCLNEANRVKLADKGECSAVNGIMSVIKELCTKLDNSIRMEKNIQQRICRGRNTIDKSWAVWVEKTQNTASHQL